MGWVSTSFLVIYAVSTSIYGKATERYSLKTLVIFAFSILVLSDLLGFFAVNYTMVLATRALQAVRTAVMPSLSMIIPARYVSLKDRGMAFGLMATGSALGSNHWAYDCRFCRRNLWLGIALSPLPGTSPFASTLFKTFTRG